jgi:hypothetical protein
MPAGRGAVPCLTPRQMLCDGYDILDATRRAQSGEVTARAWPIEAKTPRNRECFSVSLVMLNEISDGSGRAKPLVLQSQIVTW